VAPPRILIDLTNRLGTPRHVRIALAHHFRKPLCFQSFDELYGYTLTSALTSLWDSFSCVH